MDSTNVSKLWQGWTPPEGLNRSWPRPVSLTARGILIYVLSVLFLVAGAAGAVWLAGQAQREQALSRQMAADGRQIQGEVTRLWRGGGKSPDYRVAYKFTVDGQDHTGHATIRPAYWESLGLQQPIAIRYLPSDPSHSFPAANPPGPMPYWLPFLLGGFFGACGIWMPFTVRRQRRLLEGGRPAPALVTRLRKWNTREGVQYTVYYQFSLPDGGVTKGRASGQRKPTPEGSVICVLYDPDNPRRSAPYPLCMVKLAAN